MKDPTDLQVLGLVSGYDPAPAIAPSSIVLDEAHFDKVNRMMFPPDHGRRPFKATPTPEQPLAARALDFG